MSKSSPKVVVSHVNVAPFVQHAAKAFDEYGMLHRFVTTLADRPDRQWQKIVCSLAKLVRFDLKSQLKRRAVLEVPASYLVDKPFRELVRLGIARLDRTGIPGDLAHEWMETGFDRWVSRNGLHGADIVYSYENACYTTFRKARQSGIFCVYDAPAPEYRFSKRIIESEVGQLASLETAYQRHIRQPAREYRRDGRRQGEYDSTDLIVTASSVTRDSFVDYFNERGRTADCGKLVVIPYGAPPVSAFGSDGGSQGKDAVRFLWAGTFSIRKGARYLIDALKKLNFKSNSAVLDVYGRVTVPQEILNGLPDSVRFHGSISRDQLMQAYRNADLLLFPTLCDGFGMVATEAFAQGLPVLTTRRAGACDLIKHGENGFVVPPADTEALAEMMDWVLMNREAVRAMREPAIRTAAGWQWSDYRRELARTVRDRYRESLG